jgi:hypothetical protein
MGISENLQLLEMIPVGDLRNEVRQWLARRESDYRDDGVRSDTAKELTLRDAQDRYLDSHDRVLEEVVQVHMTILPVSDSRRTNVAQKAKKEQAAAAGKPREPREPDSGWLFRINRKEAVKELEAGDGRTSDYSSRVEWVGQNLNSPLARPRTAPCNAAWAMLIWAADNQKEFFALEQRVMNKQNIEEEAEAALEVDLRRLTSIIGEFGCWRRLDERIRSGDIQLEYD